MLRNNSENPKKWHQNSVANLQVTKLNSQLHIQNDTLIEKLKKTKENNSNLFRNSMNQINNPA